MAGCSLKAAVLVAGLAGIVQAATVLPDHLGTNQRTGFHAAAFPPGKALADEYGLTAAEQASYGPFTVTAYQFRDPTGAFAASQALGPGATLDGNYLLSCSGTCPTGPELIAALGSLPKLYRGPYPMLPGWIPKAGRMAGSERYVLGPASLAAFAPRIPATAAGFQFEPEAETADYRHGAAVEKLLLFSYPTPAMARQQATQLAKVDGAGVRRIGPLVAVVLGAPDTASAKQLMDGIGYSAEVTANQPLPLKISPQSAVKMVLAGFELAGILLLFCLFSGLLFGLLRVVRRRLSPTEAEEPMVVLHLTDNNL